jgi:hypothetical protein
MQQDTRIIKIGLLFVIALIFQVAFLFADCVDSPNKAVVEFTSAYFKFDKAMSDRMCSESLVVDEDNMVNKYIYNALEKVRARGYRPFYMKDSLYHVATSTLEKKNYESAKIRLTCEVKAPVRHFFTGETRHLDEVFDVVYEAGKWKVCGNPFGMLD